MARSGVITVSTAGTAVQGPSEQCLKVLLKPSTTNTGVVYIGDDGAGDVSSANGFEMGPNNDAIEVEVSNLNELWFDAATNDDVITWIKVN